MNPIDEYRIHLENEDRSVLTLTGYLSDVRQFTAWYEKENHEYFALERVTPTDVRAYRSNLQEMQKLKASSVNRKLASLSSFMKWALEARRISSDPTAKVRYVRKAGTSPKWLDRHEQFALQRAMERDLQIARLRYPKRWVTRRRDVSLVIFMLNTGLRLSEVLALTLEDIEMSERKGLALIRRGKGNKERVVPLNTNAREAVSEWLQVRPVTTCRKVWLSVESSCEDGMTARAVQRILKRLGQEAGIQKLSPHILRHTFGKNLIDKGVGVEKVAQLLGHENLNTTQIYIKPDIKDLQNAMED